MPYTKRFGTQGKANKGSVLTDQFRTEGVGAIIASTPNGQEFRKQCPTGAQARRFVAAATQRGRMMINLDAGWEKV